MKEIILRGEAKSREQLDELIEISNGDTITIYSTVYYADTNKLISAYVFILQPGVTFEKWQNDYFPNSLPTDNDGQYRITGILRNMQFTFVVYADGYNLTTKTT